MENSLFAQQPAGHAPIVRLRVIKREQVAQQVWMFELLPVDGSPLAAFDAGAHLALHLPAGVRQYSLCNGPQDREAYRIAIRREASGSGVSRHLCDVVQEGDEIDASGPFNHFALLDAPRALLLAAGIGITPILAMALELDAQHRPFELHYTGRSQAAMAFLQPLRDRFATTAHFYSPDLHAANASRMPIDQIIGSPAPDLHLYVCGPSTFIEAACLAARSKGWPDTHIHFERFQGERPIAQDGDAPFEVQLRSSGQRITVQPDETVAQALERSGVYVNLSCGSGVCGSCRTKVLEGEVDHRDYFYSAAEQARHTEFTPCCSRARSARLLLDL
jgi:vanillate O-demethylase ferredoxin subunit